MKIASIRFPRRLIQLGCALTFVAIPFLNRAEFNALSGNLLSFNFAGLTLADPLAALQVMLSSYSIDPAVTGFLIALGIAFLLGPVFCSWLCPYGFLSELLHRSAPDKTAEEQGALQTRQSPFREGAVRGKKGGGLPESPFMLRLCIVFFGLVLTSSIVPFPLLNQLSMPGWYTRALQHLALDTGMLWGGLVFLLAALLLEFIVRKRIWCRYLCPQSVLISLAGLLFPKRLQVGFKARSCNCPANDRACGKACSLALDPRRPGDLAQRAQCTNCGDCVDACRSRGKALSMRFGKEEK